jgi:hypothetical protein
MNVLRAPGCGCRERAAVLSRHSRFRDRRSPDVPSVTPGQVGRRGGEVGLTDIAFSSARSRQVGQDVVEGGPRHLEERLDVPSRQLPPKSDDVIVPHGDPQFRGPGGERSGRQGGQPPTGARVRHGQQRRGAQARDAGGSPQLRGEKADVDQYPFAQLRDRSDRHFDRLGRPRDHPLTPPARDHHPGIDQPQHRFHPAGAERDLEDAPDLPRRRHQISLSHRRPLSHVTSTGARCRQQQHEQEPLHRSRNRAIRHGAL